VRWQKRRCSREGPVLFLPSPAGLLQPSARKVQGRLPCSWGGDMRVNETLCVCGG
jgi:hypothetical protein